MRIVAATKTFQQLRFPLGDQKFISARLHGEEELIYQEVSVVNTLGLPLQEITANTVGFLVSLLRNRVWHGPDTPRPDIDEPWVQRYLGPSNEPELMAYLRTGHRGPGLVPAPGEHWDLPPVKLELEDRVFEGLALSYQDLLAYSEEYSALERAERAQNLMRSTDEVNVTLAQVQTEGRQIIQERSTVVRAEAAATAALLNARRQDGGEEISGAWLLERVTLDQLTAVRTYLTSGKEPEPEEAQTPKAEDGGSENIPINA
ncbi:hypothetical protein [Deinococcus sp.]|uniref:hypothetical protein n=1 Tax=Deinococcus sp. TaxID=47478 RepID=UPI0025F303CE|nr:hypothetical protein [Deinococcus sp.]